MEKHLRWITGVLITIILFFVIVLVFPFVKLYIFFVDYGSIPFFLECSFSSYFGGGGDLFCQLNFIGKFLAFVVSAVIGGLFVYLNGKKVKTS
jgi:ABC-type Na+ efflux pump permease subunit